MTLILRKTTIPDHNFLYTVIFGVYSMLLKLNGMKNGFQKPFLNVKNMFARAISRKKIVCIGAKQVSPPPPPHDKEIMVSSLHE